MIWSDERVELLKKFWLKGLSASQIATELGGVSRNAVIGKVHRLGLSGRVKPPAKLKAKRKPKPKFSRLTGFAVLPKHPPTRPAASFPTLETKFSAEPAKVGLLALRDCHCREVVGDGDDGLPLYCGLNIFSGSYCIGHASINYAGARRQ